MVWPRMLKWFSKSKPETSQISCGRCAEPENLGQISVREGVVNLLFFLVHYFRDKAAG